MARTATKGRKRRASPPAKASLRTRTNAWIDGTLRWGKRAVLLVLALGLGWVLAYRWIDPPTTPYMRAEAARLGGVRHDWRDLDAIAPVMARSAVAAEDADFCLHWGLDVDAIRDALEAGSRRGASTISQQVVKNAFLWQERSWLRKALEAGITPITEVAWSKRRVLEIYLNVAEFDEGVFGVQAAARHYFGVDADDLSARQAARLAAVLPNPKVRSAARPSDAVARRAGSIADGAATIRADGRAACFEV